MMPGIRPILGSFKLRGNLCVPSDIVIVNRCADIELNDVLIPIHQSPQAIRLCASPLVVALCDNGLGLVVVLRCNLPGTVIVSGLAYAIGLYHSLQGEGLFS